MTVTRLALNPRVIVDVLTVAPTGQESTNTETAVTGSDIDARPWKYISYTAISDSSPANTAQWAVYGANAADFSDEVAVQALADLTPGVAASFGAVAYYGYYRVKIHSKSDGQPDTVTVRGLAKG